VGASAAIIIILVATHNLLSVDGLRLLIIEMSLWHVTAVIVVIDLMQLRSENMGGHSHLAGALFGFILLNCFNGTDLSKVVSRFIDFLLICSKKKSNTFKKVHKKQMARGEVSFKNRYKR
jgi:hypothetical protein